MRSICCKRTNGKKRSRERMMFPYLWENTLLATFLSHIEPITVCIPLYYHMCLVCQICLHQTAQRDGICLHSRIHNPIQQNMMDARRRIYCYVNPIWFTLPKTIMRWHWCTAATINASNTEQLLMPYCVFFFFLWISIQFMPTIAQRKVRTEWHDGSFSQTRF